MGKLFNERTEILLQTPIENKYRCRWILLPMCAYKVVVPYPKETHMNLFQETILKLFASGAKEDAWIADVLALNISLVEYVVDELQNRKLLSSRRTITEEGMNILNDNSNSYELKTGYVFYNYATKTYADTFVSDDKLNSVAVRYRNRDTVAFYINESVANPVSKTATRVHAENEEVDDIVPDSLDILKICRRHKRRSQQLALKDLDESSKDVILPKNIEKVTLLGEKRYVYVATYMYLPTDDLLNRSNLQICYPFDNGVSTSILEAVMKLSNGNNNSSLKSTVDGLKMDAFNMTEQELNKVKQTHAEVDKEIKNILSPNITKYQYVYKKLLEVEDIYVYIQTLLKRNKGNHSDAIQQKIGDYVVENYNLISGLLTEVAKSNDYFREDLLTNKTSINADNLSRIGKDCGFTDEDASFSRILNVKKGSVRDALESTAVKSLLAYNLIIASVYYEHPFYKLGKQVPQFITYIGKLIELRNDSDHGNDIKYNFEMLAAYSIKNMYITYLLLDGLTFKNQRNFDFEDERLIDVNRIKVTKNAKLKTEETYTKNVFNYSVVLKKLVALQEEILLEGDDYPSRASEVIEAIFKILCGERLIPDAAIDLKDFNDKEAKQSYLKLLQQKGFVVDELPYYALYKLTNTFRNYHMGTLSTLFYAWFFSENFREDSMISDVAFAIPELVNIVEAIVKMRQHNKKSDYFDEQLNYIKANFDGCVNNLIDIMDRWNID